MFIIGSGKVWRMVLGRNSFLLSCLISRQTRLFVGECAEHRTGCQFLDCFRFPEILHFFSLLFLLMPVIRKSLHEECVRPRTTQTFTYQEGTCMNLVVGATGFLGSEICRQLTEKDKEKMIRATERFIELIDEKSIKLEDYKNGIRNK